MKISARNMLKGKVKDIKPGAFNSVIILELSSGEELVSLINNESLKKLELAKGKEAYAVIKASNIVIAVD